MSKTKTQKLFETASLQQGYFTAKQAINAGFTYRMQSYYRKQGHWLEIGRGIFRLVQFPNSLDEDYVKWSLWSRNRNDKPQAVISHQSALSIHELSDVMPPKVHITVPCGFRKNTPESCIVHKGVILPEEREEREGYYVTGPLRTIIDSADSNLSMDYLEQAVVTSVNRGMALIIDIATAEMSEKALKKIITIIKEMQTKI